MVLLRHKYRSNYLPDSSSLCPCVSLNPKPWTGEVTGMGIQKGVTLIVGGGFHGKSTLLQASRHAGATWGFSVLDRGDMDLGFLSVPKP